MKLLARLLLAGLPLATPLHAQDISVGLDIQTNAVVQVERGFDGSIWGITSSSMDLLPTVAGVFVVKSVDEGATWTSHEVTSNWWRWGSDICPLTKNEAWSSVIRDDVEDTLEVFRTSDGGRTWSIVKPADVQLDRIISVHFFSPTVGIVFGSVGRKIEHKWTVSRTTDGGKTWSVSLAKSAFGQEQVAERNDRSAARFGSAFWLGLSSGRILFTQDAGATWSFISSPLGGSINAIVPLRDGRLLAVRTKTDGSAVAMTTRDGNTWEPAVLPPNVTHIHGLYARADGSIVTVPSEITQTPMLAISADLTSAVPVDSKPSFGVIELKDGSLLTGTEAVRGKGLRRVKP